jgi:hypothetical protein
MNRRYRVCLIPFGLVLAGWLAPAELPAAPAPPGPVKLQLSWTYVSSSDIGFGIDRATSLNGPWTTVATVPAPATNYLDMGLRVSTTYYYRVWAYNAAGDSDYSNIASILTPSHASVNGPSHSPHVPPPGGGGVTNQPPPRPPHGRPVPPTVGTNLVPPVITALRRSGVRGMVSFGCTNGLRYTLEYKSSLADSTWTPLPGFVTGTNGVMSLIDSNAPPESRFYRIRGQRAP